MKKTITIIIISFLTLGINAQTVQGESVSVNDITIPNVNMIKFTPLDGNTSQLESIDNVSISARGTRVDIID